MDSIKALIKYLIHPLWMIKDGKASLFRYLSAFERSQFNEPERIREAQFNRVREIVRYAYENCPFYRKRFDSIGMHPSDLKNLEDFLRIPYLTKTDIQENLQELTSQSMKKEDLVPNRTGGSTGQPIRFYHDRKRVVSMEASAIRHDRWAGHDIGDKLAVVWGHREDLSVLGSLKGRIRERLLLRGRILDSSSMSHDAMKHFALELIKFQPKTILAYANAMFLFARFCREHRITGIRPEAIITSAEVLHDHERAEIEGTFLCRVFNRYGCREVSVIASECEEHTGMHINADALYVEFMKDNGEPAKKGEIGDIIITDLYNFGMPFIRYRIEDMGSPLDEICPCGRGLPMMDMVAGRVTDFLLTPEGKRISGAALTIYVIANTPGVRQAQFVQNKEDELVLKIVRGGDFNEDSIRFLENSLPGFFGRTMHIEFQFVDEIPKEASGKYRFSVCNIKKSE